MVEDSEPKLVSYPPHKKVFCHLTVLSIPRKVSRSERVSRNIGTWCCPSRSPSGKKRMTCYYSNLCYFRKNYLSWIFTCCVPKLGLASTYQDGFVLHSGTFLIHTIFRTLSFQTVSVRFESRLPLEQKNDRNTIITTPRVCLALLQPWYTFFMKRSSRLSTSTSRRRIWCDSKE